MMEFVVVVALIAFALSLRAVLRPGRGCGRRMQYRIDIPGVSPDRVKVSRRGGAVIIDIKGEQPCEPKSKAS